MPQLRDGQAAEWVDLPALCKNLDILTGSD
jgi:hypothetical protein